MTTDTVDKQAAVRIRAGGAAVTVGGMAKGAGMIHPNMATLLAFLTSDAAVRAADLQLCLREAVNQSFNCICVDNDQSTNDTVLLLANGRAENETLHRNHRDWPVFCAALNTVTRTLALKIVADGEGATKMVIVTVSGAASDADAEKAARAICNSMLVKTSWFGEDPNWGRVIDAVGYSGARMKEDRVGIAYDGVETVRHGRAASGASAQSLKRILAKKSFTLSVRLNIGRASCTMYTCDLSHGYVTINGSYMT
jgi:glutamate N-acetyltransferase/amino-acid N-acetyltransferase